MSKFYFLTHDNVDPYFNLASEEYLLKERSEFFIYLWINSPAVIVGINQNAIEEVNLSYTESAGVKVVRRLTGGGAVYHDLNNLCYTVIAPFDDGADNYKKFTAPVIEYLNSLGVKAEFSGRNDISVDGRKISGNAQTVYNGRIMHHGTLLFKTDTDALVNSLKPNRLKIESKGIKSVRARVANLSEFLPADFTVNDLKKGLEKFYLKDCERYTLKKADIDRINILRDTKYSRYEWNFGRSPSGKNLFERKFPFGVFSLRFDTVNGKMENVSVYGDFFSRKDVSDFAGSLSGVPFEKSALLSAFEKAGEYIVGADGKEIAEELFK